MTKVASMKVQVSADTSRFDAAMHRMRGQMKQTQQAASMAGATGLAGPMGGRLGAGAALMGLSGPMMAIAAATAGLSAALQSVQADRERGRSNLDDIVKAGLTVQEQARFSRVAGVAGAGNAGDVASLLSAVRPTTMAGEQKLLSAGMTQADLAALAGASDTEALRLLVDLARSPNGLEIAKALGGGAGQVFAGFRGVSDVSNIQRAMAAGTSGELTMSAARDELLRQNRAATADPNEPGFWSELWNTINQGPAQWWAENERKKEATDAQVVEYLGVIANKVGGPE